MRARRAALFVSCLALSGAPASSQDGLAELEAYVAQAVVDWEVPGLAIAVVDDGELVFAKGYGVRELGSDERVDEHTLFSIGSTTKAMTAAGLGRLVDSDALEWDDRVATHWPAFELFDPYATREVTVRDLLTHRAGLGNADLLWYGRDRSRADILARIPLIEPAYSLRAGFVYQNIMYVAAGALAARLDETTWEEHIRAQLFQPLGMERTMPTTSAAQALENVARPHDRIDGRVWVIENETLDTVAPAGAVWSSVSDMSRWLRMLLAEGQWVDGRVLAAETVGELLAPQTLLDSRAVYPYLSELGPHWVSYALGWFQLDYHDLAVSFHTGSIDGMSAIVGLVPEAELGVVVLANVDHAELRHALLWHVVDRFARSDGTRTEEHRDWSRELRELYGTLADQADAARSAERSKRVPDTSPSVPLERFAGIYTHALYGDIEVSLGETLRIDAGVRRGAELEHWHYDTFLAHFDRRWQGEAPVTFQLDAQGAARTLEFGGSVYERQQNGQ